jgi:hypothetical protein
MIAGAGTTSSSGGTATAGPYETSSSGGTMTRGTTVVMAYDSETSSSPMCKCFMLGTSSSSSLMCAMPNSSFIISIVICKNRNTPK